MAQDILDGPILESDSHIPDSDPLVNEKVTELYGWTAEKLRAPVEDNDYGMEWPDGTVQYFKEGYGYRMGGIGGLTKFDHMVNMIKLDLPFFEFESMGYINSAALRVLKACCEQIDLGIAGAASTGKTYPVAAYLLQDWKTAPHTTLTFVCTTSLAASDDRIWGAIVKQWQSSVYKIGTYVPYRAVIVYGAFSEKADDRDLNSAIKAVAVPKGEEGKKSIGNFRGRKQLNVRLCFDELPEMDKYVGQGAFNLESNTPNEQINAFGLQVIGIGNPNDPNDAHGDMCRPDHPMGFASISQNTREWKTRTGWAIFLSGLWSPNFEAPVGDPVPFPRLTNRHGLARMLVRAYGNKNSIEYWRNAIGFWPNAQVVRTVLTRELITGRGAHKGCEQKLIWKPGKRIILCGFDIGFVAGGDKCVAQFIELGRTAGGKMVVSWIAEAVYMPEATGTFEETIAKQVVDDCIRRGVDPSAFGMDISGDGGKMLREIIRYWMSRLKDNPAQAAEVVPISSMGTPTTRIFSNVDPRQCKDVFDRRVTEYWMMIREGVLCEVIKNIPMSVENTNEPHPIVEQLCTRQYEVKGKKFSIETKDKMKERTSGASPDNADAFVYAIEMARRHGLEFTTPDDTKRAQEKASANYRSLFETQKRGDDWGYDSDSWGEDLLAA